MREHSAAWDTGSYGPDGDAQDLDPEAARRAAHDEATVRRGFWRKLRQVAVSLPFAEDLIAAYYCAFDQDTPVTVKASLLAALAYFVLPFDVLPDMMPLMGFTDDAAVLATALRLVAAHVRPSHYEAARGVIERELRG